MTANYEPKLTYGDYLKVPELLSLQTCLSKPEHHDELHFIIVHQVYELWFKLMLNELEEVIREIEQLNARRATDLLRRIAEIQRVLLQQIRVLETMKPVEFLQFRSHLRPASGFQSVQFRELELLSGLKDARFVEHHREDDGARTRLEARLNGPSLASAFFTALRKSGFKIAEYGQGWDEAIRTEAVAELLKIYQQPAEYYDLYQLAEGLLEYDEQFMLWRFHHVRMVERMIGEKSGTGGSLGVRYLESTLSKRFFPELWQVRTLMNEPATY